MRSGVLSRLVAIVSALVGAASCNAVLGYDEGEPLPSDAGIIHICAP